MSAQAEGSESKYPQQKRKIAADEAEVNSAEQDAFISAQILLSEEGLNAADAASNNSRDVDGDKACADDCAAAGE